MTWRCPVCGRTSPREGMCRRDRLPFRADPPAGTAAPTVAQPQAEAAPAVTQPIPAVAAAPIERLALRMPWRQQINLPDEGDLVLGRQSPQFQEHPEAATAQQVSRRHARFYRDDHGHLYVEDLTSANGTYVDGVVVEGAPRLLRAGQTLRLAQDVDCQVIRLNEHGEPM